MYKVFFVDDEASMRAGIRESIEWDDSGFILAGEAPDGEMALSLMQEILPDILITDVRMPFMDGIELSRQAKKIMPWIKILILSGHDEFEYAKQAIAIGVEDYLLKPVTSAILMETLTEIANRIDKERRSNVDNLIASMQDISAGRKMPLINIKKLPIIDKLRYATKADAAGFVEDYLLKPVTSANLMESLSEIAKRIDKERRSNVENLIASMQDISAGGRMPIINIDKLPVIDKLRYATKADADGFVEDYLESFDNTARTSFIFLFYIFMDILLSSSKIIEEFGGDAKEVLSEYFDAGYMLQDGDDIEKIRSLLKAVFERVVEFRDTATGAKYSDIIVKAHEYIKSNYSNKDISLHTVAKEVSVSPNHFSTVFSKETGETFISYITGVRIEQAKVLLKTTQMRTSDVGYEVGYNDTQYFSYVFKKQTGMTPKEFRGK